MKVTQDMIEAFAEQLSFADHELDDEMITPALQAVLDLIVGRVVRTSYRSIDANGELWSESSDPTEFPYQYYVGRPLSYQRRREYAVSDGWEEWTPGE